MSLIGPPGTLRAATGPYGRALVTSKPILPCEVIIELDGVVVHAPDRFTIQIDHQRHLAPSGQDWALINHSCTPNARFDPARPAMVAVAAIQPGEEITFNYLTTEWQMAEPFRCGCGAPHCPGTIAGFRFLSPQQREALLPYLSPHLACAPADAA